jgi:pimeloyl-ACP methyl ester carboxylesterase
MVSPASAGPSRRTVLKSSAAGAVATTGWCSPSSAQGVAKAIFVLVHPAWLGGWCWRKVTPLLRDRGHDVYTPTLTGLGERAHLANPEISLATHVEDVVNVLEFEDLHRVILVGNSSGGMVITGVADRVPTRLAQVVYLDAFVPGDGQSLVDLLPPDRRQAMENLVKVEGQGWLLPRFAPLPPEKILRDSWGVTSDDDVSWALARLRPTPFRHFIDPVNLTKPAAADVGRVFIRCQQFLPGKHPAFDRHLAMARQTPGWRAHAIETPHLPYVTHPAALADVLLDLATWSGSPSLPKVGDHKNRDGLPDHR